MNGGSWPVLPPADQMFDGVRFEDYRCLADVTIELGRITLLVGANGSGKSTVLEGLSQLPLFGQRQVVGRNPPWRIEGRARGSASIWGACAHLVLDAAQVAAFVFGGAEPSIGWNGCGTAAAIASLVEKRAPELDAIEADLRRVIPRARRLLPCRAERHNGSGWRFALEMDGGAKIAAYLLSEGTLLTIGLLAVLHAKPSPTLVLLDNIERALHPTAQRQLVECIKRMLSLRPDLQFVCATHSPVVLDHFEAHDVWVLSLDARGFTCARRLSDHPQWEGSMLKAGEFWSHVGEDWVHAAGQEQRGDGGTQP